MKYLKQNQCLIVGLEIASYQQTMIKVVMPGRASVADIDISPIIDHLSLRRMIKYMAIRKQKEACLK